MNKYRCSIKRVCILGTLVILMALFLCLVMVNLGEPWWLGLFSVPAAIVAMRPTHEGGPCLWEVPRE